MVFSDNSRISDCDFLNSFVYPVKKGLQNLWKTMIAELETALECIASGATPQEFESDTLEFKQDARSHKESMAILADAAACFVNTEGGTIVVGVADSVAGLEAIVGTRLDAMLVKQRIYELTQPPLLVTTTVWQYNKVPLIVITVPVGVEIHADKQGRIRHRIGRVCLPMTSQEQVIRTDERRGVDWSVGLARSSLADIKPETMQAARERLRRGDDEHRRLANSSTMDLLRSLGVLDERDRLLRAGELLLTAGEHPRIVYQHRLTPGGEITAIERLSGPLLTALDKLMDLAWARRHVTPLTLPDASQVELADFPLEAIREVVANAVLHRELRIDRPVVVEHSSTVFVVESPGRLVTGVTEHNILTHPSKPRNLCLFQAARRLRMAEDTGQGIDRVYRELIRSGRDTPTITQTLDTTRVAFVGGVPRTQLVRFIAQLGQTERDDVDTLLLIFTLLTSRTITEAELAPIIQKQPAEAGAVLERLSADQPGIIETTLDSRTRRKPTYRLRATVLQALGDAVIYQNHRIEDIDLKVINHVKDYGWINNRTLRHLFDINVHRASSVLRDLRNRELLVKISGPRRGPGVRYGPGPKFPAT